MERAFFQDIDTEIAAFDESDRTIDYDLDDEDLAEHPVVTKVLDQFWNEALEQLDDDKNGTVEKDEYAGLYRRLVYSLEGTHGELSSEFQQLMEDDWKNDSAAQGSMGKDQFCHSILEFAYTRSSSATVLAIVTFLLNLYRQLFIDYNQADDESISPDAPSTKKKSIDIIAQIQMPDVKPTPSKKSKQETPKGTHDVNVVPESAVPEPGPKNSPIRRIRHGQSSRRGQSMPQPSASPRTLTPDEIQTLVNELLDSQRRAQRLLIPMEIAWLRSTIPRAESRPENLTRQGQAVVHALHLALAQQRKSSQDLVFQELVQELKESLEALETLVSSILATPEKGPVKTEEGQTDFMKQDTPTTISDDFIHALMRCQPRQLLKPLDVRPSPTSRMKRNIETK